MKSAEPRISEAELALQAFEGLRRQVDADLAKPKAERDPAVVNAVVPALTELIELAANRLRLTLETWTDSPSATMTRLVGLRHLTAKMAESAGRERALLAGLISAHAKLTADGLGLMSGFRGHVELAWETISPIAQRADVLGRSRPSDRERRAKYFQAYGSLRADLIKDGKAGAYKITGKDYMASATSAINAILQLGRAIAADADREAAELASRARQIWS